MTGHRALPRSPERGRWEKASDEGRNGNERRTDRPVPPGQVEKGLTTLCSPVTPDGLRGERRRGRLGRAWPQDGQYGPIDLFGQLAVATRYAQRRDRDGYAHHQVQPQRDKRRRQHDAQENCKQFTHAYILNALDAKWNPDATLREPQMARAIGWNHAEGPTCFGSRRLFGSD
jgi:hypothetical protein